MLFLQWCFLCNYFISQSSLLVMLSFLNSFLFPLYCCSCCYDILLLICFLFLVSSFQLGRYIIIPFTSGLRTILKSTSRVSALKERGHLTVAARHAVRKIFELFDQVPGNDGSGISDNTVFFYFQWSLTYSYSLLLFLYRISILALSAKTLPSGIVALTVSIWFVLNNVFCGL